MIRLTNNAGSSLVVAIAAADTEVQVQTADAAEFPVLEYPDDVFPARIRDDAGNLEYVLATGRDGNRVTILRGREGTTARDFPAGALFELVVTGEAWDRLAEGRWVRPLDAARGVLLPTRIDADTFTIPGDVTALFRPNRALHLVQTTEAHGWVATSTFAGGTTTVVVQNCTVDTGLALVELGLEVEAAPKYGDAANADTLGGSSKVEVIDEVRQGLGSAAFADAGDEADQVPFNSILGAAAYLGVGAPGGVQAFAANLLALSGLVGVAGKGFRFTGPGEMEIFTLSDFAKTVLDDADAAAVRATLGVTGGEWEQVGFANVTTPVASVNFTGLSANSYDYRITAQNVVPSSGNQYVYGLPGCGPGSVGYTYGSRHQAPSSWGVVSQGLGGNPIVGHYGWNPTTPVGGRNFDLMLRYVGLPGAYPVYEILFNNTQVSGAAPSGGAEAHNFEIGSSRFTYYAAEVPNFGMFFSVGNIDSGTFKLYRRPRL